VRIAGKGGQHRRLVAQRHVDRIDHQDRGLAPRIVGPPHNLVVQHIPSGYTQPYAQSGQQRLGRVIQRQLQFGNTEHRAALAGIVAG
jgi:hypothetical protein